MAIRFNPAGLAAILSSPQTQAALDAAGEAMAEKIRAEGIGVGDRNGGPDEVPLPVTVRPSPGRTARTKVSLAHPAGEAVQAKHGSLTRAAGQVGLKFRGSQ